MVDDSSITRTETKNNKKPANNESNASPSMENTMQDVNKSYHFMDRPWVLAKPLRGRQTLIYQSCFMSDDIHELPVGNTIDLHNFRPNDAEELIKEFISGLRENSSIKQGIIIHGKGTGSLRELTHSISKKTPKLSPFNSGIVLIKEIGGRHLLSLLISPIHQDT